MPASYERMAHTRIWVRTLVVLSTIVGIAAIGGSMMLPELSNWERAFLALAGAAVVLGGAFCTVACVLLLKIESSSNRLHELMIDARATQDQHSEMIATIRDNSLISDGAKTISHRAIEREALRKAIREDIIKGDWESAYSLIEDMENRFGYRLEAYNYRKEVDDFRAKAIEDKVQNCLKQIRKHMEDRQWESVQAESQRLVKLAPSDERVEEITNEVAARKERYKTQLLEQWHAAVEQRNLNQAIELLREIDPYLSREETKNLEDSARSIFKAKLLDLGVQFRTAAKDKRWQDAISVGEQIRSEFPNSLMAEEVGDLMDTLKAKLALN